MRGLVWSLAQCARTFSACSSSTLFSYDSCLSRRASWTSDHFSMLFRILFPGFSSWTNSQGSFHSLQCPTGAQWHCALPIAWLKENLNMDAPLRLKGATSSSRTLLRDWLLSGALSLSCPSCSVILPCFWPNLWLGHEKITIVYGYFPPQI